MLETRLDTTDFRPAFPAFRLALACAAFGFLGLIFALETRNEFTYGPHVTAGFLVERAGIAAMLLVGFSFIVLLLLLPFRIRFTEGGIRRRSVLRPRFVPWRNVTGARLASYKGGVWLELKVVGRRTWIIIPVAEYRRAATLLAELRRRLPVEIRDPGGQLAARLTDG